MSFENHFTHYLQLAQAAHTEHRHHDYRRQIFLSFLNDAFGIQAEEVNVEQFIKIDLRRRGWIDALFQNVVFEFKTVFEKERPEGKRELRDYMRSLPHGRECIGILTDGLLFEAYRLAEDEVEMVDSLTIADTPPATVQRWLDAYLFSATGITPTTADIVQRYGAKSPTFQIAAQTLGSLLDKHRDNAALGVKLQQWRSVLAKVYGSDIADDALFIRHTYLSQFAKQLAYAALYPNQPPHDDETLAKIVTGEAFHAKGVSNVGEIDFFSWILDGEVRGPVLEMLTHLAQSLVVYDLNQINEDLFKQLYQNLVDPDTRHDLGEFYTPDWLAELTLQEIDYRPPQSLLDPSCGSGTFLFSALRRLAAGGLTGWALVDFALQNVAGMDVHPLAVTIARINYLLAILPHMRGKRSSGRMGLVPLPVYMADALQMPEVKGAYKDLLILPVDQQKNENFFIPKTAAESPLAFSEVIDRMNAFANRPPEDVGGTLVADFTELVTRQFGTVQSAATYGTTASYWGQNLRLLNRLIHDGRDSIWAYMLKNTARPLLMAVQQFDVIVGNPPWLAYRYIKDKTYQQEVKRLIQDYGLIESGDVKLYTQMELATLFMVHCQNQYIKPDGTIAMVMPRSVITGAKHHRRFQGLGLTRVLDLLEVKPLFNVPSCVLIWQREAVYQQEVPTTAYLARLPHHEMSLAEARPHLRHQATTTDFVGEVQVTSPYYDLVKQGATLVPRNLCFVKPVQSLNEGDFAANPTMHSDPDADKEAKAPWKGIKLQGLVYETNLYATLLSKYLVPFGYRQLHLVALPVRVEKRAVKKHDRQAEFSDIELKPMGERDFLKAGLDESWRSWFGPAERLWDERKKDTSTLDDLIDQYNYQQKLTSQRLSGVYKVIYNKSGTNLASCVFDTTGVSAKVYEYPTNGFIVDFTTYGFDTLDLSEAHYLCAILNAPCVDQQIKAHQSQGTFGQRDIHRTPFEACAIPRYDANDPDHQALARLSQTCHAIVAGAELTGQVVKARRQSRAAIKAELQDIDTIARRVLGLNGGDDNAAEDTPPLAPPLVEC